MLIKPPEVGTRVPAGTYAMIFILAVLRLGENLFLIKYANDKLGRSKSPRYAVMEWAKLDHQPYRGPPRPKAWKTLSIMKPGNQDGYQVWRVWASNVRWDTATNRRVADWAKIDATFSLTNEAKAVDFTVRAAFLLYKNKFDLMDYYGTEVFSVSPDRDG